MATTNQVLNITSTQMKTNNAIIGCSFNQSFYCVVCCSTDPSVPPDSSVYNVSSIRGTEVTVYLGDLTSGQMYYCKASATNTTSANGGVKVFFSFIPPLQPSPSTSGECTPCAWNDDIDVLCTINSFLLLIASILKYIYVDTSLVHMTSHTYM